MSNETKDVKGVFKIENKRKTIFQLENYFTPKDEQLLISLGNSISLSLIISERFDRLKRLEKLVSKIRVLGSLEEALFFILTGLTHGGGLRYNRAMIFLYEEKDSQKELVCRFAMGPLNKEEWDEMTKISSKFTEPEFERDLDNRLTSFHDNKEKFCNNPMMNKWQGTRILVDDNTQVISYHAKSKPQTGKYLSKNLSWPDILADFPHGDYVLIPISQDQELLGIIYADNRFTGNPITQFECEVLDIFSGIAAAIIQTSSKIPEKIKRESEEAWRKFSQPAAHRLGTETSIIDGEINLFCKPQLENMRKIVSKKNPACLKEIEDSLAIIEGSITRLRQATKDYQQLTPDPEAPIELELNRMIKNIVEKTTNGIRNLKVDMQIEEKPIIITAYKNRLTYVFEELLLNALKELDQKQINQMRIKVELWQKGEKVFCRISDTGSGVPSHVIPQLFKEPVSEKGRRGGTGLGMFLISRFLGENGGGIELSGEKPENYGGASFLITLPRQILVKN